MFWLIPFVILTDQFLKIWAIENLQQKIINFWFIDLTYVENTGIAFGMFKGTPLIHGILSSIIVGLLFYFRDDYVKRRIKCFFFDFGMSLIIGGALGNIFDRIRIGYVVDYISVPFFSVFNFADSCITVGAISLVIHFIWGNKYGKRVFYK